MKRINLLLSSIKNGIRHKTKLRKRKIFKRSESKFELPKRYCRTACSRSWQNDNTPATETTKIPRDTQPKKYTKNNKTKQQ